jgi:hypothetical protein
MAWRRASWKSGDLENETPDCHRWGEGTSPHYPPAVQEVLVDAGLHASIPGPIWDRPALRMRMYGNKWKMSPKWTTFRVTTYTLGLYVMASMEHMTQIKPKKSKSFSSWNPLHGSPTNLFCSKFYINRSWNVTRLGVGVLGVGVLGEGGAAFTIIRATKPGPLNPMHKSNVCCSVLQSAVEILSTSTTVGLAQCPQQGPVGCMGAQTVKQFHRH